MYNLQTYEIDLDCNSDNNVFQDLVAQNYKNGEKIIVLFKLGSKGGYFLDANKVIEYSKIIKSKLKRETIKRGFFRKSFTISISSIDKEKCMLFEALVYLNHEVIIFSKINNFEATYNSIRNNPGYNIDEFCTLLKDKAETIFVSNSLDHYMGIYKLNLTRI